MKKGWQAFDVLDEAWCPIVQVHGLFTDIDELPNSPRRCGLLMELYGVSLYDVLQKSQHNLVCKRLKQYEEKGLPPFHNEERITVAQNVASACRYLHDLGMLHRDLKDMNVLVDPGNDYKAKLTDFGAPHMFPLPLRLGKGRRGPGSASEHAKRNAGTSKNTREALQRQVVGTAHTLAPEALLAADGGHSIIDQADKTLDYRAIDVYAYGILLCALWDGSNDQSRHIPLDGTSMINACRRHVCDTKTYKPDGLRPALPERSEQRELTNDNMPKEFEELMKDCWRFYPEMRPTFSTICKRLKKLRQASQAADELVASLSSQQSSKLRVVLNVTYNPKISWEQPECVFELNAIVESPDKPLPTPVHGVTDDIASYSFPFLVCVGESVEIKFVHVFGDVESTWFSSGSRDGESIMATKLLTNIQGRADMQAAAPIVVKPDWGKPKAQQTTAGAPLALMLRATRTQSSSLVSESVNLGVLQVELLPKDGVVPHIQRAPPSSARRLNRMSTGLRQSLNWKDCQVFLSYRDQETGLKGSNFAFRLQEALEFHGYTVFCYGAVLKAGHHWVSPFNDGVNVCEAFIPICSPEYGDMELAPWTTAELLQAARERATNGRNGLPHIIPIRHHGTYPPKNCAALADILEEYYPYVVPDQEEMEHGGRREARLMKLDDVWQLVIARLQDAGVVPAATKKRQAELAAAPTLCTKCGKFAPSEKEQK